jgi:hypothetical protein
MAIKPCDAAGERGLLCCFLSSGCIRIEWYAKRCTVSVFMEKRGIILAANYTMRWASVHPGMV